MASQTLPSALRAPGDIGEKLKIASTAWDDKSLYMPNKGEVISEWILTRLLKDKANPPAQNPLLDPRFWTLLSGILSDQSSAIKPWLVPLLNRVPFAPIVTSFLQLYNSLETHLQGSIAPVVNDCFARIWPFAVHKISAEALLECFGAFLVVLEQSSGSNDNVEQIGSLLISSLRSATGNSSNKKKLFSLFIQNHLRGWIIASSCSASSDLRESVYLVGIELLFNADTLRAVHNEEHPLFTALRGIPHDLVHPVLSRIFEAFVQCIRKHRSALFGQSSGHASAAVAEQVRSTSFIFFDSCQALLNASNPTVSTWAARVGLLTVVGDENLFSSSQVGGQMSLQSVVPLVLSVLGSRHRGTPADMVSLSVDSLSKLMQIDHDLMLKDVPRILPELLRISEPPSSVFRFLEILLDYHVKTRTMQTHIESLFAASTSHSQETELYSPQQEYHCFISSAFLHPMHLERLKQSTETFLTPSQIGPTVAFILETLQTFWNGLSASNDSASDPLAVKFSFSARLASVVLTALPMQALSVISLQEVDELITQIKNDFLPRALAKTLKTFRKNISDAWAAQIVAAASLRLAYALDINSDQKLWTKLEASLEDAHLLPELSLEIFRILLKWTAFDELEGARNPMDALLSYLEDNYDFSETSSSQASHKRECVLTILHMLIERWLPTIEAIASTLQLQRLVKILLRPNVDAFLSSEKGLNTTSILLTALSSAQFWELPNLRTAILAFAEEATSTLAGPRANGSIDDGPAALATYHLLLLFPIEYFTRAVRTELVKRAIDADVLFAEGSASVTVLRLFIYNISLYNGSLDQAVSTLSRYLTHLTRHNGSPTVDDHTDVTLGLIGLHFSTLLRSTEETSVQATLAILRSILPSDLLGSPHQTRVLTCFVQVLTKGFTLAHLPNEIRDAVISLEQRLSAILASYAEDMSIVFASEQLMNLWLHNLILRRWLKIDLNGTPLIGRKLSVAAIKASTVPGNDLTKKLTSTFAILTEELHLSPGRDHLEFILAIYVSFSRVLGSDGQDLDQVLSQTINILSANDFSHVLDLTRDCLTGGIRSAQDLRHLVHLAALLLSEHPPGTLKHTQQFLTSCLNLFAAHIEFASGPLPLRLEVLRLLRQQCSDKPASLLALNMGSIWLLLSTFLAKSKQHDETTSTAVFHEITATIGALIRLRRDLVTLTLPHLALVLQQLMATIRRARPQLGAKQTALVADSLPLWVNSAAPIGPEEAKALARLLETLTAKTTVRTHSSSASAAVDIQQRAESLARPFSKHAAYIIKAYIDAMTDSLCLLSAELRRELRPGLFALCGMLNDHSRDAMMVSALDAGGKTVMKNLWAEYEKQKYVGKG